MVVQTGEDAVDAGSVCEVSLYHECLGCRPQFVHHAPVERQTTDHHDGLQNRVASQFLVFLSLGGSYFLLEVTRHAVEGLVGFGEVEEDIVLFLQVAGVRHGILAHSVGERVVLFSREALLHLGQRVQVLYDGALFVVEPQEGDAKHVVSQRRVVREGCLLQQTGLDGERVGGGEEGEESGA